MGINIHGNPNARGIQGCVTAKCSVFQMSTYACDLILFLILPRKMSLFCQDNILPCLFIIGGVFGCLLCIGNRIWQECTMNIQKKWLIYLFISLDEVSIVCLVCTLGFTSLHAPYMKESGDPWVGETRPVDFRENVEMAVELRAWLLGLVEGRASWVGEVGGEWEVAWG